MVGYDLNQIMFTIPDDNAFFFKNHTSHVRAIVTHEEQEKNMGQGEEGTIELRGYDRLE